MKEAFTYMFKDNKYLEKAGVYAGLVLLANLLLNYSQTMNSSGIGLLLLLLGYLALFIPSGYGISCIKAIFTQDENIILPAINIKKNFILGFKIFVAGILLGLAIGGILLAVCIIFGIIGALTIPKDYGTEVIGLIFLIPFLILAFTIIIVYLVYGLAMSVIFAKKEFYTTFFKFDMANQLISQNPGKYFSSVGIYVLVFIAVIIVNTVPGIVLNNLSSIGTIILSAIQAVVGAYTIFVFAYITAKSTQSELLDKI